MTREPDQTEADYLETGSTLGPDDPPQTRLPDEEFDADNDAAGRIRLGRLAGKTLGAAIWILAAPVLLQQFMQATVGLADQMYAGHLEPGVRVPALDAIGIGSYIGWFIGIAMAGLGIGGQALIARGMGAGDAEQSHAALGQAIALSAAWGAAVGVVLWYGVGVIAVVTELSPEATFYCYQYVRTIAVSMPLCGVMIVGSMCLHGAGETLRPSLIAMAMSVLNVIASWVLSGVDIEIGDWVLVNPFAFDLEVVGIAAGTALSYAVGGLLTLLVLFRGVEDLRLHWDAMKPRRRMVWRVVRVGAPNFAEGIVMWGVNLVILHFIGLIGLATGETGVPAEGLQGAHIIAVRWESFSFLPGFAIGTAAGALAGQYLGAGNAAMARKAVVVCTGIAMVVMGLLGVVFMAAGEALTALVSTAPIHLEITPDLLFICGTVQIFFAMAMVVRQGLRGVGDTRWTLLITAVSSYAVRLPAAYVLGVTLGLGMQGIWLGLCGEFVVRAMLFLARFLHGGWQRIEV